MDCCGGSAGCASFFGDRFARRSLRRYREKGLQDDARTMVEWASGESLVGEQNIELSGDLGISVGSDGEPQNK